MATEIERKFLVKENALPGVLQMAAESVQMVQGYIETSSNTAVRLRRAGTEAFLTIKGPGSEDGTTRLEFEYAVPVDDAEAMLEGFCGPGKIEKTRYRINHAGHIWEVDVFAGLNAGLVLAEVELAAPDELVELPQWIDREVTGSVKYYNSQLAIKPYSAWPS